MYQQEDISRLMRVTIVLRVEQNQQNNVVACSRRNVVGEGLR
jgi:hypothetical protein